MRFRKIKAERSRLADQVYHQLLNAIHRGEFGSRERIIQNKVADEFNISRTPVREALLHLERDGILVSVGRGGFALHQMTCQEVVELYEIRVAIEGYAARLLATHHDARKNADLRETIKRSENSTPRTAMAYFNVNRTIHRRIVELAENRYLLEMFDNIWNRGTSFRLFTSIENVDLSQSLGNHLALAEAIEQGDGQIAVKAMETHIKDGLNLQLRGLSKAPGTGFS